MPITNTENIVIKKVNENRSYFFPLALITSLFFLWGLAYGLLDVLNKHFQDILNITKQRSMLLQAAYFGAYFLMALPAGAFMTKLGYKKGIITGLLLYAVGAFLFYPAATFVSFNSFLLAVFILASGLTFLETAANPYVTILGKAESSAFRLNLSQSFNGLGSFIGPVIGAQLFFNSPTQDLESVKLVYLGIGGTVLVITFLFVATPLPEIRSTEYEKTGRPLKSIFEHSHFVWAIVAQFFYVAAQVGMAALFINYCTEKNLGITNEFASYLLSLSLLLFTAGRFAGTALMKVIPSNILLSIYAVINIVLCVAVIQMEGMISIYALMGAFFFASIMFPTIFALGIKDLGPHTKRGASFIIMAIVGGAAVPYVMGSFSTTSMAFIVPLICFFVVFLFGIFGYKVRA